MGSCQFGNLALLQRITKALWPSTRQGDTGTKSICRKRHRSAPTTLTPRLDLDTENRFWRRCRYGELRHRDHSRNNNSRFPRASSFQAIHLQTTTSACVSKRLPPYCVREPTDKFRLPRDQLRHQPSTSSSFIDWQAQWSRDGFAIGSVDVALHDNDKSI